MATRDEITRRYWLALGRFIDAYSTMELILNLSLRHYAKMPDPVAQAIFFNTRIDSAIQFLNRLIDTGEIGEPAKSDLKALFAQLLIINRIRNDVIHYGANFDNDPIAIVSNSVFAHTADRIRQTPISPEILEDLICDLGKIHAHFVANHVGLQESDEIRHPEQEILLKASWRYKPALAS
jgi:hypothetical protein